MITINRAVIVEGKYDKIKLSQIIDATIITTNGFGLFKDKARMNMIRRIAQKHGILILTDSDSAGFLIRSKLMQSVDPSLIVNAYIPEILGKEKRKSAPSKEGLLGVEGVSDEIILAALKRAGIGEDAVENEDPVTVADMFDWGLSGGDDSAALRNKIKTAEGLPEKLSSKELITVINSLYSKREFCEKYTNILGHQDDITG